MQQSDLDELTRLVGNVMDAYTAAFFEVDVQMRTLRLKSVHSLSRCVLSNAIIHYGEGIIGWVAQEEKTAYIPTYEREKDELHYYSAKEDIKSLLAVPILKGDLLIGVLAIDSKRSYIFTPKEQKLLTEFAYLFSRIIDNSTVQHLLQTESENFNFLVNFSEQLSKADSLQLLLNLLKNFASRIARYDSFVIALRLNKLDKLDEKGEKREMGSVERMFRIELASGYKQALLDRFTFSPKDSFSEIIVQNRSPLLIPRRKNEGHGYIFAPNEPRQEVRSFMGSPLIFKGEVLGLICFVSQLENVYVQRQLDAASVIANQLSASISSFIAQDELEGFTTTIDGLTGLLNLNHFKAELETEVGQSLKYNRPLSLILAAIGNLGEINEIYGYMAGDDMLRHFSKLLLEISAATSKSVKIGRYGGNKFILMLPNCAQSAAKLLARKISDLAKGQAFVALNRGMAAWVELGIASLPYDAISGQDLIYKAHQLLDLAKMRVTH